MHEAFISVGKNVIHYYRLRSLTITSITTNRLIPPMAIHKTIEEVSPVTGSDEMSYDVTPGDVLELKFGEKLIRVEVLSVADIVGKAGAEAMYRQL